METKRISVVSLLTFAAIYPLVPLVLWGDSRLIGQSDLEYRETFGYLGLSFLGLLHGCTALWLTSRLKLRRIPPAFRFIAAGGVAALPAALILYAFVADPSHNTGSEWMVLLGCYLVLAAIGAGTHVALWALQMGIVHHHTSQAPRR